MKKLIVLGCAVLCGVVAIPPTFRAQ